MCNHYANDLKKLGRFLGGMLGEQFSETKVPLRFANKMVPEHAYPDRLGVVIRQQGDGLSLDALRWGFPKVEGTYVTNARWIINEKTGALYPHWAEWSGPEYRCIVPVTSFFEPDERTKGGEYKTGEVEFARTDGEPLFFPGFWRPWSGPRGTKKEPIEGEHELYTLLTTFPNKLMKPIHKKAMPAIITWDQVETWLNEPIEDAIQLQRPAAEDVLTIVGVSEPVLLKKAKPKDPDLF